MRWDAGLFYDWRNWSFRFTVENVTDETYYLGSQNRVQNIAPGAPRQFAFGVRTNASRNGMTMSRNMELPQLNDKESQLRGSAMWRHRAEFTP